MTTALVAQHEVEEEIAVLRGEKESERGVPDWSGSRCHVICAVMCRLAVSLFFVAVSVSPHAARRSGAWAGASKSSAPSRVSGSGL